MKSFSIENFKELAKKTAEKTKEGIDKINDQRQKTNQETKLVLPASSQFDSSTTIRKTTDGLYYVGFFTEEPELFEFAGFEFAGSTIIQNTITKGTITQKGRIPQTLGGGLLGGQLGAMVAASGKRKGIVNSTSKTTSEEKAGKATVLLRNLTTGEVKKIKTKLTNAQANNVQVFFEI